MVSGSKPLKMSLSGFRGGFTYKTPVPIHQDRRNARIKTEKNHNDQMISDVLLLVARRQLHSLYKGIYALILIKETKLDIVHTIIRLTQGQ